PDDLARVVDALWRRARRAGQGIVDSGVSAAAVKEAVVDDAAVVPVIPDDLAQIVNAVGLGEAAAPGIIEGGVSTTAGEVAVVVAPAVDVIADRLAGIVDARGIGAIGSQRIAGYCGVGATAEEEAGSSLPRSPDDLAQIVDAVGKGDRGAVRRYGPGIEGGVKCRRLTGTRGCRRCRCRHSTTRRSGPNH